MKKLVAFLLLVAVLATSIFAAPFAGNFTFEFDEDVSIIELTESDSQRVEGEGLASALIGIPIGGLLAVITVAVKPSRHTASSAADTILQGMVTGFVGGLLSPTP